MVELKDDLITQGVILGLIISFVSMFIISALPFIPSYAPSIFLFIPYLIIILSLGLIFSKIKHYGKKQIVQFMKGYTLGALIPLTVISVILLSLGFP